MAMHLLIDGYNLIGSQGRGLGDVEKGRGRLLGGLVAYKRLRKAGEERKKQARIRKLRGR